MQSNNPVFRRSKEFQRGGRAQASASSYSDPSTWSTGVGPSTGGQPYGGQYGAPGAPTGYGTPTPPPPTTEARRATGPMTIDTVVQASAVTIGTVVVAALVTWLVTPDITVTTTNLGGLYAALLIGGFAAFGLSMVNSFKRVVSPALVLLFAVAEGVSLGAFSKVIDAYVANDKGVSGDIVIQAVIGTFAAFAGTLAVYKFMNIKVGDKFRTMVFAAMWGLVGLSVLELVIGLFGASMGIFGFGAVGFLFSLVGLVLGVFMLVLDFDFIEQGIRNGLPQRESWRAAFALTVSLVWIYTNLLRLLAMFSRN